MSKHQSNGNNNGQRVTNEHTRAPLATWCKVCVDALVLASVKTYALTATVGQEIAVPELLSEIAPSLSS
eukprot:4334415-Amphidinium_carterae.1